MKQRSETAVALALAGFLACVYLLTYSGAPHSPDEWFYLAGAHYAVTGDWASVQAHGRLFTLLVAPFYAMSAAAPLGAAVGLGAFQSALLAGSVIAAATAALLYALLSEFGLSRALRLVTALLFGLATLAWPYSHYLFREPAAGLALLGAVYGVVRWARAPVGWRALVPLLAAAFAFVGAVAIKAGPPEPGGPGGPGSRLLQVTARAVRPGHRPAAGGRRRDRWKCHGGRRPGAPGLPSSAMKVAMGTTFLSHPELPTPAGGCVDLGEAMTR